MTHQGAGRWLATVLSALAVCAAAPGSTAADEPQRQSTSAWQALQQGGHVALMRHALAPGTGDPERFQLDDCGTQRNLSDAGRAQASAIGARFRARGIDGARIYSSRWCRCLDTARLLDLGPVMPFDGLNSFFRNRAAESRRTQATLALIREQLAAQGPPLLLVTHQVNITALTGVFPDSGEILVTRLNGDALEVVARLPTR